MIDFTVDHTIFKFKYIPKFSEYILQYHLKEFTTVNIRFCREANLPLLKPLKKLSEEQLVALTLESSRQLLEKLSKNEISEHIEANLKNWIDNKLGVIDKDEIMAEDLTLAFYLRRKTFAYFLYGYTKNVELQKSIIAEMDVYTTQEELVTYNIYLKMQQEKLAYQNELLLEAQELAEIGWFYIDYKDRSKSQFTSQYLKILELDDPQSDRENFTNAIHPDDKGHVISTIDHALKHGGKIELEYSYIKNGKTKRIWTRAIVELENGTRSLIKGTIRDITKKYELIQKLMNKQKPQN